MKHKYTFIFVGIFLASLALNAQIPMAWAERYNAPPDMADDSRSIAVDPAGNIYVTGSGFNSAGNLDAITIKYDSDGNQVWVRNYDRGLAGNDEAQMLALDPSGNVYIVGYSHGGSQGQDALVVKYDSSGNQQWVQFYNGTANGIDEGRAIAVNSAGDVFIAGYTSDSAFYFNTLTVKYNTSGTQQWAQIYNGPVGTGNDELIDLEIDGTSNVYVTGSTENAGPDYDCLTIKYDASGSQQWLEEFDGGAGGDFGKAITVDVNGNVLVAAQSGMTNQWFDYLTIKYSNSGSLQWTARYNNGVNRYEYPYGIVCDNAGYVYITGQSQATGNNSAPPDATTVKYSPAGGEVWVKRYDAFAGDDRAYAIVLDDTANVYVTGYSYNGSNNDFITIKYDSAGTEEFVLRLNSQYNQNDASRAIAVQNGDIYVTGQSANTANEDFLTIRYSYSAVGISENIPESVLKIYPVPASDLITVELNDEIIGSSTLVITDNSGRTVAENCISPGSIREQVDISGFAAGLYTLTQLSEDGDVISRGQFVRN